MFNTVHKLVPSKKSTPKVCVDKNRSPATGRNCVDKIRWTGLDDTKSGTKAGLSHLGFKQPSRPPPDPAGFLPPTAGHAPTPTHPPTYTCHTVYFNTHRLASFGKIGVKDSRLNEIADMFLFERTLRGCPKNCHRCQVTARITENICTIDDCPSHISWVK